MAQKFLAAPICRFTSETDAKLLAEIAEVELRILENDRAIYYLWTYPSNFRNVSVLLDLIASCCVDCKDVDYFTL